MPFSARMLHVHDSFNSFLKLSDGRRYLKSPFAEKSLNLDYMWVKKFTP